MINLKNIIKNNIDKIVYSVSIINLTLVILFSLDVFILDMFVSEKLSYSLYEMYRILIGYIAYCSFFVALICLIIPNKIEGKYKKNNKLVNFVCLALCVAIHIYWCCNYSFRHVSCDNIYDATDFTNIVTDNSIKVKYI